MAKSPWCTIRSQMCVSGTQILILSQQTDIPSQQTPKLFDSRIPDNNPALQNTLPLDKLEELVLYLLESQQGTLSV